MTPPDWREGELHPAGLLLEDRTDEGLIHELTHIGPCNRLIEDALIFGTGPQIICGIQLIIIAQRNHYHWLTRISGYDQRFAGRFRPIHPNGHIPLKFCSGNT